MSTLQIPRLDAQQFRRRLANLEDYEATGVFSTDEAREAASDFCCALAVVFNRGDLKAITLWPRIGSAVESSLPRAEGGDLERFEEYCLRHVKARIGHVAASAVYAELTAPLRRFAEDPDLAAAFVRYLAEHTYSAVIFGKQKWERQKESWEAERQRLRGLDAEDETDAEGGAE